MRCRGIVECRDTRAGELQLTHKSDVENFDAGDELYTRADVPELVALELKRRGKTSAVEGPFVLSESERGSLRMASRGFHDNGTVGALCRALERAVRTLGPQAGGEWTEEDRLKAHAAARGFTNTAACIDRALDAVKHRLYAPLVLPPAEPQPDAPTDIASLPGWWDQRRKLQNKPDLSRCAAELRVALASSARDDSANTVPLSADLRKAAERIVAGGRADFDQESIDCAEELLRRCAGPASSVDPATDKLTAEERACVNAKRHVLEDGEEVLVSIIDRLAPDPDPVDSALVDAVCRKMDLVTPVDKSFAQAVLETAHALRKAGAL